MGDPIVIVFDCETTGTDRAKDQIIEVCIQRGLRGTDVRTWRIKPAVPIHPAAQALHGITAAMLDCCPSFREVAEEILDELTGADVIVGYNVDFDLQMFHAELARIGWSLDVSRKAVVDAYRLWQQCEPRKLQNAHERFVGHAFEGAHHASADVAATGRVLEQMITAFGLAGESWETIARRADPERGEWLGPSRHFRWQNGRVIVAFGKHAGKPLDVLAAGPDANYLTWLVTKGDFPQHVKTICEIAIDCAFDDGRFLAWAREHYPPPPPKEAEANA